MRIFLLIIKKISPFLLMFPCVTSAQKIEGIYTFSRQEIVASFNFKTDNTFEFFYTYGASDRHATGTFSILADTVRLKSDKDPGKDFTISLQSKKGKNYRIEVTDANKYLLRHIIAVAMVKDKEHVFESDENGIINVGLPQCDKIYLQHQLFPDVLSLIKDENNGNNYFEITLNPSLAQVSFKGIDLIIDGDELKCLPNYFIPLENIRFIKE